MNDVISRGVKQKLGNKKLDKGLNKNFFGLDSMNPIPYIFWFLIQFGKLNLWQS